MEDILFLLQPPGAGQDLGGAQPQGAAHGPGARALGPLRKKSSVGETKGLYTGKLSQEMVC